MFYPKKEKFIQLSKKGNLIPVCGEYFSDLETPVSTLKKITDSEYSFILESVEGGRNIGRYSFIGTSPSLIFTSSKNKIDVKILNKEFLKSDKFSTASYSLKKENDPIDKVAAILDKFHVVKDPNLNLPRFYGGFVGYVGYDMVKFFEPVGSSKKEKFEIPDCVMLLIDKLIIFDHLTKRMKFVCNAFLDTEKKDEVSNIYNRSIKELREMVEKVNKAEEKENITFPLIEGEKEEDKIQSNISQEEYKEKVKYLKSRIEEGEIIQAVLSQRLCVPFKKDPFIVYRILRAINPSPYMFHLKIKHISLVGSSPEVMVRSENRKVELRPIAGTRPRGHTEEEDIALEKELISDEKERAEHIMLVDLGRNDVGRVCKYGSVKVPELMTVEKYSHVLHLVSSVVGELQEEEDIFDLFRACFPAGTVTGAPKVRAMQLIREVEESKRGPYAGCVGYFSFSGNMDTCITIRTIISKDDKAYVQAGAGIVADSVPQKEYEETLNKAQALIKALKMAKKLSGEW